MNRGTVARINVSALQHNLRVIQRQAKHRKIWAVIKADAYGHGAVTCAKALCDDVDGFAVATFGEALELRQAGITTPILMLEGASTASECLQAAESHITQMFHHPDQLAWLDALPQDLRIPVWLKVDTGMHRLGLDPDYLRRNLNKIAQHPQVDAINIASHFACADTAAHPLNQQQLRSFSFFTTTGWPCSMANSAAIWNFPESHFDWIRPGIALFGASPIADTSAAELGLRPVMNLTAPIIAERWVEAGESVGYGCDWVAQVRTRVATVGLGYADGYPRQAPSGTPTRVCGHIAPLVGRVSMDMITVDVTHIPEAVCHSSVELWGDHLPVDEVAQHIGTIGYDLLTRVSSRVPRL